jgi:hypothetical protein
MLREPISVTTTLQELNSIIQILNQNNIALNYNWSRTKMYIKQRQECVNVTGFVWSHILSFRN